MAIGPGGAVAHETVEVRMGDVALELAELSATWPRSLADIRAFELARRMLREGEPETCRVGTRGHVVPEDVVRVGDPVGRHRVVRRDQDLLGVLARQFEVQAITRRSERGEVGRVAGLGRMTLGLDRQVVDKLVAVLDAVFHEEAVTDGVVGHVVFNAQEVRAMHGHAAVVGVVNRGVPDVLPLGISDEMPMDRIPGKRQVLTHAIQLDALDIHVARRHRHDMTAEERLFRVGRCLDLDIACQQTDFAALIHVESDLAEVHVIQLLVERDLVSADGGNAAPLGLSGIVIRRREDNLVAHPPARGVQDLNRSAACLGRAGELGPGVGPITVQVQGSARDHDPAVTHASHDVFTLDGIGEGDGRVARVRAGFAANGQLPVQHDPLGGQLQVGVVCEGELAVDGQTEQRRRTDVEHDILVSSDGDLVACDWHLVVWPGGRIGPERLLGRLSSSLLSANERKCADEAECR